MNRFLLPLFLAMCVTALLTLQCTVGWRWTWGGAHLELLPPLLLYASFTVNLPTALVLGLLGGAMYDSFSGGNFGTSMIPYVLSITLFAAVRPVFFRNSLLTQFFSGMLFAFLALLLQWMLCGKFPLGWHEVLRKVSRLAVASGGLAILYFALLDGWFRMMGMNPGRFEEAEP